MKKCTCCEIEKPFDQFYKNGHGLQSQCKTCLYIKQRKRVLKNSVSVAEYQTKYWEENKDRLRKYSKEYRSKNKDRLKALREADRDYWREYNRQYHASRKEEINKRQREYKAANRHLSKEYYEANKQNLAKARAAWAEKNKHLLNAKAAKRRALMKMALPEWADLEAIAKIYKDARDMDGMHVDHIVPLQAKIVCGLHVACNLQILPASENLAKCNRYWPDMP